MAVLVKPGNAWQDPEDIQTPGAGGVMESVKAVREPQADGTWVDVWPEYQQAVHYLMLYDYGDMCRDVTGGYYESVIQPAWGNGVGTIPHSSLLWFQRHDRLSSAYADKRNRTFMSPTVSIF